MEPRTLTDGTIVLSPPRSTDIDALVAGCCDPEVARWTTVPSPYTRDDAVLFVDEIVPRKWADGFPDWAIRTDPDGVLLGMIGFVQRERSAPEIGYWLAPGSRGRGLATAAVRSACEFAFHPAGLAASRVEWRALVGNVASAVVAQRVGFRFEGVARHGIVQRGIPRDTWVAGLLPDGPREPAGDWPNVTSGQLD